MVLLTSVSLLVLDQTNVRLWIRSHQKESDRVALRGCNRRSVEPEENVIPVNQSGKSANSAEAAHKRMPRKDMASRYRFTTTAADKASVFTEFMAEARGRGGGSRKEEEGKVEEM
ncbi:hypothetical protein F2P81_022445 [Scophthalmus maximus]|uniref:Uncharacterized protein n=1 Tax=Scophthalmus maximus TaxID=52904 RepID=A0A6A4S4X3_SCOMX|nr:hypothetical protein F2P81_022445 [Scophthalmus maximus]